MLGLDLHAWEEITLVSLAVTAIAAITLAVATWAVVRLQRSALRESNAQFQKYKLDAQREIEGAKRDAAQAALQTEQLRLQMAPRRINEAAFLKEIEGKPRPNEVEVLYLRDDAECFHLAFAFMVLLHNAHWPVGKVRVIPPDQRFPESTFEMPSTVALAAQPWGVSVVTHGRSVPDAMAEKTPTPFGALFKAVAAGIGRVNGGADASLPEGKLRIVVAPKERK